MPPKTKQNATKPAKTKTATRRRHRRRGGSNFIDPACARYLQCAAGGHPANTGVPDGDGRLSIVKNIRDYVTITPDATGTIEFVLGVSPQGHATILRGLTQGRTYPTWEVNTSTGAITPNSQVQNTSTQSVLGPFDGLVPVTPETLYGGIVSDPVSMWRVVNAQWRIHFTGSALANGGNCVVTPWSPAMREGTTKYSLSSFGAPVPVIRAPRAVANANPSSMVRPAHKSLCVTLIPRDTSYQSTSMLLEAGQPGSVGVSSPVSIPSGKTYLGLAPHQSCRMYHVVYTGLDSSASITIDNMTCIQYLVDPDGSEAPLARPSEVGNQSFLSQFLASISNHPAVGETVQEVKNGIFAAAGRAIAYGARTLWRAAPLMLT